MASGMSQDKHAQPCQVAQADVTCVEACVDDGQVILPPTLRVNTLSVEGAKEIQRILDNDKHPVYAGREMPTADVAVHLIKSR